MSPLALVRFALPLLAPAWSADGMADRLAESFQSFWFYLTNDVEQGKHLVPKLLAAWIVAGVVVTPLSFAFQRWVLKSPKEFRQVLGTNLGLGALQAAFFALDWYVLQWGTRSVDWGVLSVTLVANAIIVKLALERSVLGSLIYAAVQTVLALGAIFLALFAGTEAGVLEL